MILVIETATSTCSVALFEADTLIDWRHAIVGRGHAERLLPMIADLLGGKRPDGVSVDCGPGSFTGVRVGLAAARGLGLGWNVPVTGFSSLALIATESALDRGAVAIPGGHGELFVARFGGCPRGLIGDSASLTPAVAAEVIPDAHIIGAAAATLVNARGWGEAVAATPDAARWARIAPSDRTLPARPIYGRPPDARAQAVA